MCTLEPPFSKSYRSATETVDKMHTSLMDSRWEYWKKLFREIVDSYILLKKARVRTLPWITQEVCALMRARSHYCTKAKKSGKCGGLHGSSTRG